MWNETYQHDLTHTAVTIRPARETDARKIAEVHDASSQAIYRGLLPDEVLAHFSIPRREALWKRILSENKTTTFVLERDGVVIGFADAGPTRDADKDPSVTSEITTIYLDPAFWGKGLGKALCRRALDDLRADGFEEVTLWVLDTNRRARAFYEKMGFERDGTEKVVPMKIGERKEVRYGLRLV